MCVQFKGERFMNCSKNIIGICKKIKYDCQTWNIKEIIDVNKHICKIFETVNITIHEH